MRSFIATALALAAGTTAHVIRTSSCCFHLSASGAVTGTVGQLSDGQNRIGGGLPPSQYCIDDGAITDSSGRGCVITSPTEQFQCDMGASATTGFTIDCNGIVSYDGSSVFYECQTGDNGEANIYTKPGGTSCATITLKADGCAPACPPKSCPANLNGAYEYPHLIVPISSKTPNTAAGTSYNGVVTSSTSSIFNFDIPTSDAGKTCSLIFLFPTQAQLTTSSFTISGNGGIDFSLLGGVATQSTTYDNAPAVKTDYGVTVVAPGNAYTIATFPCPSGQTVSYELKASGDTQLTYFQDYNPSPIGLYIVPC